MASYTGILADVIIAEDAWRAGVSANISGVAAVSPVAELFELESVIGLDAGALHNNKPIEMNERSRAGTKVNSFVDDYYYRVHVTPLTLALGEVLSELVDTFIVWNAWFEAIDCDDITENGGDEFELDGEEAVYTLEPLEYQTYTVTIPKEGSANIASSIDFTFDTGEQRSVIITGIRMIVFYFPPQVTVKESYEFATDIITPRDGIGSEQRISYRQIPRQSFVVNVPLKTAKEQNRFDAAMFGWAKRYFGFPIRTEKENHSETINQDDLVINVDTTFADFRDESYALIFKSIDEFEAVKIDTVAADSLTLESAVVASYTGNKWIAPLRITQVTSVVQKSNPVADVAFAQVSFAVKDNILLTGFVAEQTYNDLPILLVGSKQLNGSRKESSIDSDSFVQDYGSGDFDYLSDSEFNLNMQGWGFVNETKEAMWVYKQFIHSLLGRQGTMWVPTYTDDLTLAETIGASDTSFQIENIKLAENMGLNDLRTHLSFIFPNGDVLCREITGIVESDDDIEIISIDSDLGLEVEAGDCQVCFLDKCRMASDTVVINHLIAYKNYSNVSLLAVKE